MAEVERILSTEQKATDYRSPDDGIAPDHRPTQACSKVVAYLSRVLELAFTALEGLNKQAFLAELGNRLHKGLLNHWQKFTFNASGGLHLNMGSLFVVSMPLLLMRNLNSWASWQMCLLLLQKFFPHCLREPRALGKMHKGSFSFGRITRVQSLQRDSAPYGLALVRTKITC
ncbi:PREDICTED: exocyst complex component 5-like [Nicotiana attenuata]|uniref:exocyst complex component 5-like n=1 Tax=Nicotiana attenuata TaxID=49451 RepID=UPI000905B820|nr:PREDICTED: exocyst complex component 5-like [Nicotiana attenuata]